jgi:molybdopterin biosynthesis enzyme
MVESVEAAWRIIEEEITPAEPELVEMPLDSGDGRVTAGPIHATSDSPPFDKALMDGYAIRSQDYSAGVRSFEVIDEVVAGKLATRELTNGTAIRIMTGAPLPNSADCVIPVELVVSSTKTHVTLEAPKSKPDWNLARRGQAIRAGDLVIPAGTMLGPAQLGALAEMGITKL